MGIYLEKERSRVDLVEDEEVQERHLVQVVQALGWVQRHLVRVDHFAGELRHLLARQLSGLLLLLQRRSPLSSLLHVLALVLGVHLLEGDVLEHLQLSEVVVAVRLLQQFLVLLYFAVIQGVQECELA